MGGRSRRTLGLGARDRSTGVDAVKNFGGETRDQARSVKDKLSNRIAERKLRRREDD